MKTIQEYLDKRHPETWGSLSDNTKDFLGSSDPPTISEAAYQYAEWHRAHMMTSDGHEFYRNASNDEIQEARSQLTETDLDYNPYQMMCNHNYHILVQRYSNEVNEDILMLCDLLHDDLYNPDSDVQSEITHIETAIEELDDSAAEVKIQLREQADALSEEADEWHDFLANIK